MPKERLFLIDGHALCYRSFFAIRNLTTSKGQATNAVYGFITTIKKILRQFNPEYVAVCFDSPKKTRRQEKFAEYKIQRPRMPDDLISQIPLIKDVVEAYHLPILEVEGYEADDLIATLTRQAEKKNIEVVIVTEDKDMFQLLGDKVSIFSTRKDTLLSYDDIKKQLEIDPENIVDFLSLAGDSSDNIPGVKGIGEVTARQLIQQFGRLENIIKHSDEIKAVKVREKIVAQKDIATLSKELAILDANVPVSVTFEDMKIKPPDQNRLLEIFRDLEFQGLAEGLTPSNEKAVAVEKLDVSTDKSFAGLVEKIKKDKEITFVLNFSHQDEQDISHGMYVAMDGKVAFVERKNFIHLSKILNDSGIEKVTYDVKKVLHVLSDLEIKTQGPWFDVMLAGYLLSPAQASFALKMLVWNYLKETLPNGEDSHGVFVGRLFPILKKELQEKSLMDLFNDIEIPLALVLFQMEHEGVRIDVDLLQKLSKECEYKIQNITKDLYAKAGGEFNLNSPKQLSQVLFERLKLPVIKKTKTGFSTDEEVLTKLAPKHEVPAIILEYRQLAKLKSTYIDALPQLINSKTNRIHAHFNQTGAETGRLSSNNPNLQNIPIRAELGRQIRRAFIPLKDSHVILSADYSQIELRILAHLSQDENLLSAFQKDQDIHNYTAALIFEVPESKVDYHMRDTAKRVNFGIIYGISSYGLSRDLGISPAQAQDFIDKYFLRYPKVKKFMDLCIEQCQAQGYVLTLFNRRRYIPEIHNRNTSVRQFAERQAINTPVQGSAADLIKLAMINIQNEIDRQKLKSKMLITVHDELVFDCPSNEKEDLITVVREKMEHVIKLSVPIKVSINVGKNWLDTKEI